MIKNYLSTAIGAKRGGNQLTLTSQCASKNTITSPLASRAPRDLVLIKPSLLSFLINFTLPSHRSIYESKSPFKLSIKIHTCYYF